MTNQVMNCNDDMENNNITEATEAWMKLGYSLEKAQALAWATVEYSEEE
jgi:hypothetical protein